MSGLIFGLIIGYLSWHAFRPDISEETVPIQKIASLFSVIAGASILTLFPAGTALFERYSIGIGIGFFFPPVAKWTTKTYNSWAEKIKQKKALTEEEEERERKLIDENWIQIERTIKHKLRDTEKIDEKYLFSVFIDPSDLQELPYSHKMILHVMKQYASKHVRDKVFYKVVKGKPKLFVNKKLS